MYSLGMQWLILANIYLFDMLVESGQVFFLTPMESTMKTLESFTIIFLHCWSLEGYIHSSMASVEVMHSFMLFIVI